jgi:hypothetical protein
MKYAIEILRTEEYRLGALIRQIESNEHQCFNNIDHTKQESAVVELRSAIERLQDTKELAEPAHNSRYVSAQEALNEYSRQPSNDFNFYAFSDWVKNRLNAAKAPHCT